MRTSLILLLVVLVSLTAKVNSTIKTSIETQPESATINVGEDVELLCVFNTRPAYCGWTHDGTPFGPDGEHIEYIGIPLTKDCSIKINGVTLSDSGKYQCHFPQTGSDPALDSDIVTITVQYPPQNPVITGYNAGDPLFLYGSTNTVTCVVSDGNPEAVISWLLDTEALQGNSTVTEGSLEPLKTVISELVLTPDVNYDNDNLSCISTHLALAASVSTYVVLKTAEPVTTINAAFEGITDTTVLLPLGSEVKMVCTSDGNPKPDNYIWLTETQPDVFGPVSNATSYTIAIEKNATYYCGGSNIANLGIKISNPLKIFILKPVTVTQQPQNAVVNVGDNVNLNCQFSEAVEDCIWKKDGNSLTLDDNTYILIGDPQNGDCTIQIHDIQYESDGVYACEALGAEKSEEAIVTVLKRPDAPVITFDGREFTTDDSIATIYGNWPISCTAKDGNFVPIITLFQDKCILHGNEQTAVSSTNPVWTTITSNAIVTLSEQFPTLKVTCISQHPTYEYPSHLKLSLTLTTAV